MLKNQNRINNKNKHKLSTFFLYIKLLKKWGKKQKKKFMIANIFMVILAVATSMYPLVIDFAFDTIEGNEKNKIFFIPVLILFLTITKGLAQYFQTIYVGKIANGIILSLIHI